MPGACTVAIVASSILGVDALVSPPWTDTASCAAQAKEPACFNSQFKCDDCCDTVKPGSQGWLRCWGDGFTYDRCCPACPRVRDASCFAEGSPLSCERCCDRARGPRGDASCWAADGGVPGFGFERCCLGHEPICTPSGAQRPALQTSDLGQDRFALLWLGCPAAGFYLDLGAHDGQHISNTHAMDVDLGWQGICVDAVLRPEQFSSRSCKQVNRALHSTSGQRMIFQKFPKHSESSYGRLLPAGDIQPGPNRGYDDVLGWWDAEEVYTTAVGDLLKTLERDGSIAVPPVIDFVSIDVEGVALEVLKGFPFEAHCVRMWAMEIHSPLEHPEARLYLLEVIDLLQARGYVLVESLLRAAGIGKGDQDYMFAHRHDCAAGGAAADHL